MKMKMKTTGRLPAETKKKNPANAAGSRPRPKAHGNAESRRGNPAAHYIITALRKTCRLSGAHDAVPQGFPRLLMMFAQSPARA
jgi:hypothetical protein